MEEKQFMLSEVQKAVDLALDGVKNKSCNIPEFLKAFANAKRICLEDTTYIKLSSKLITLLYRLRVLLSAAEYTLSLITENTDSRITEYCSSCLEAISAVLSLMYTEESENKYLTEKLCVGTKLYNAIYRACEYRLYILSKHKKIFSALPELEIIYSLSDTLKKAVHLLDSFDSVNNMFTLST